MKNDFCYLPSLLDWGLINATTDGGCLRSEEMLSVMAALAVQSDTDQVKIDAAPARPI